VTVLGPEAVQLGTHLPTYIALIPEDATNWLRTCKRSCSVLKYIATVTLLGLRYCIFFCGGGPSFHFALCNSQNLVPWESLLFRIDGSLLCFKLFFYKNVLTTTSNVNSWRCNLSRRQREAKNIAYTSWLRSRKDCRLQRFISYGHLLGNICLLLTLAYDQLISKRNYPASRIR